MQSSLNIVELIEQNPITRLSSSYNSKLLNKIKDCFTEFEQQVFVSSFYCYLNYDKTMDFVIDLDDVWKWLGFFKKANAKYLLDKHFYVDIDYKHIAHENIAAEASAIPSATSEPKKHGGQNKQIIMLNIQTFKTLCLKAGTKKADNIHKYYMKMEEMLHEIMEEETNELRLQLEQKDEIILEKDNQITEIMQTTETEKKQLTKDKQKAIEETLIKHFPLNTECIYVGTIDNTNEAKETLMKFGHTNHLQVRLQEHRKIYDNFVLLDAFKVQNKVEIENLIKTHPKIKKQIRSASVHGKNKTELVAYDSTNFTVTTFTKYIKEIIQSKIYSIDNYNRLIRENDNFAAEITTLKQQLEQSDAIRASQLVEICKLKELLEAQEVTLNAMKVDNQSVFQNVLIPEDDLTLSFNDFIAKRCLVRPEVYESSTNMEGAFRIWNRVKPKKETFHALKNYLDVRFKPSRLPKQDKDQLVHGYIGVKLIPMEYTKKYVGDDVETFVFQVCKFSPSGKILNSTLLSEYQRWKKSLGKSCSENDMADLKKYLNASEYVLKATVATEHGTNEGYYGILLKQDEFKHKMVISTTGKTVEKVEVSTGTVLATWSTIAKAADAENMSAAKMSRSVKNKTVFGDYFYSMKT